MVTFMALPHSAASGAFWVESQQQVFYMGLKLLDQICAKLRRGHGVEFFMCVRYVGSVGQHKNAEQ
jgi:hypothetical protein